MPQPATPDSGRDAHVRTPRLEILCAKPPAVKGEREFFAVSAEPDDPLDEIARELRQGPGAEFRAEAELDEIETETGRRRRRSLADVARSSMHRGDTVSALVAGRTLIGRVDAVGVDYLVLVTAAEAVDVRFDASLLRVVPAPSGGHDGRPGSATLRARLAEYEQTGERVTALLTDAIADVTGTIRVVATDHVRMVDLDGADVVVPLRLLAGITRPLPGRSFGGDERVR